MDEQITRFRGYVRSEREAALLYRRLADTVEGDDRAVLLELARGEEAHAAHWEAVLAGLGQDTPAGRVRLRLGARLALSMGRRFGLIGALPLLERHEGQEIADYDDEPRAPESMVAEEEAHTQLVRSLAPTWRTEVAGTLRAGIFGFSDGVVSNLALVIGVLGAGASAQAVVTAGIAGLIAGAMSMAVGEYVSVASQREVLLAGEAEGDTTSPLHAAVASFLTFAVGAVVPLVPFLLGAGLAAAIAALALTGTVLYGLGAALSLLTLRPAWRSGLRQLGLGWGAALATYLVGLAIGTSVA